MKGNETGERYIPAPLAVRTDCVNFNLACTALSGATTKVTSTRCLQRKGTLIRAEDYVRRGHSWKLKKPRCPTPLGLNTFSQRVINLWSDLSQSVVKAKTVRGFKTELDKIWLRDMQSKGQ